MLQEIEKLDGTTPRADALKLLEECLKVGADNLVQLAASKLANIPVSGSIRTSAMLPYKEHGRKLKDARASEDTFEALGLASTMTPHRDDLRLAPITREMMVEAGRHAQMPIPRIIHQIWIGPKPAPLGPPERWKKWCDKYGYEYRLWRENDVKNLPCYGTVAYNSFLKRKRYAGVADVIRADILHEVGGLYVDMDMFPIDMIALKKSVAWRGIRADGRKTSGLSSFQAGIGLGAGTIFASFLRFWAVAASRNSSRAPHGPRSRRRSSRRMRFRCANSISTFFRSRREAV